MGVKDFLYHYRFRVDRVIDGDTVIGRLDKGRKNYDEDVRIRLLGIDAPEKRGETRDLGLASKSYLEALLRNKEVIVKTHKDRDDDSFGRMLGELYIITDDGDVNVQEELLNNGYAVPRKD